MIVFVSNVIVCVSCCVCDDRIRACNPTLKMGGATQAPSVDILNLFVISSCNSIHNYIQICFGVIL